MKSTNEKQSQEESKTKARTVQKIELKKISHKA
jgi:hypothetical protein